MGRDELRNLEEVGPNIDPDVLINTIESIRQAKNVSATLVTLDDTDSEEEAAAIDSTHESPDEDADERDENEELDDMENAEGWDELLPHGKSTILYKQSLTTYFVDIRQLVDWIYLTEGITRKKRVELKAFFKRWFPQIHSSIPTIWRLREKLEKLAGITPVRYDCCVNSCMAFTGDYSEWRACLHCGQDRYYNNSEKPRKTWIYVPLTPRLMQQFSGPLAGDLMQYRSQSTTRSDGKIRDIFDGKHYKDLVVEGFFSR